jgi:cell division protein ZapA (FtsZ GTPase activity inhibitor)
VSSPKPVEVLIAGQKLMVTSDHPAEYTRGVAAYLDQAVQRIRTAAPTIDGHRATILAALAVTDELFQSRQNDAATTHRVDAVADQLARLLPPALRGSRAQD